MNILLDIFSKLFTKNQNKKAIEIQIKNTQLWNQLFKDIKNNMHRPIEDPEVQKLVDRWEQLMHTTDVKDNIQNDKQKINTQNNVIPEGIRKYAAEFDDPSAFIQQAIACRYKIKNNG